MCNSQGVLWTVRTTCMVKRHLHFVTEHVHCLNEALHVLCKKQWCRTSHTKCTYDFFHSQVYDFQQNPCYTVVVTTVTFRQICPRKALTLASACRYFVQDVQHSVRGAVHLSIIHMLQYSMLHSLECGIHTSPDEEDVQAKSLVLSALRRQVLRLRWT